MLVASLTAFHAVKPNTSHNNKVTRLGNLNIGSFLSDGRGREADFESLGLFKWRLCCDEVIA
jgi:hypothetical protein